MVQISNAGLSLIKGFEGYHRRLPNGDCVSYRCPAGVWTLGYGCTEGIREGMTWTQDQAEDALRKEIARFEAAVTRLVTVPLNQNQYDALVSFAYNCGEGALAKSSLLRRLNAGDYEGAADSFAAWNRGGGRVLPGLVTRRAREAALFREPAEAPEAPAMPQQVDPPPEPTRAEEHKEAHEELSGASWLYRLSSQTIKTIVGTVLAAAAYLQEHAVEVVAIGCAAVIAFELYRLSKRNKRIAAP